VRTVTFEFDSGDGVASGNIAVPFTAGDSAEVVALSIAGAVNSAETRAKGLLVTARALADLVELDSSVVFAPGNTPLRVAESHSIAPTATVDGYYALLVDPSAIIESVDFGYFRIPHVGFGEVSVQEGNFGWSNVDIEVFVYDSFGAPLGITYSTRDGTAFWDVDEALTDYEQVLNGTSQLSPSAPITPWTTTPVTRNDAGDYGYKISGNYVVWQASDGHDWEIYLRDISDPNSTPVQLTDNEIDDAYPNVRGGYVFWSQDVPDAGFEIIRYTIADGSTSRLTTNDIDDIGVELSDTHAVWTAGQRDGEKGILVPATTEVYVVRYDVPTPSEPTNISFNAVADDAPRISGDKIIWVSRAPAGDADIMLYDLAAPVLGGTPISEGGPDNGFHDERPQIDGNFVVWQQQQSQSETHIILYNLLTQTRQQMSDPLVTLLNQNPQISSGNVVWEGYREFTPTFADWGIYHRHVESPQAFAISDNFFGVDEQARVLGNHVVWVGLNGEQGDVFYRDLAQFYEDLALGRSREAQNVSQGIARPWTPQIFDRSGKAAVAWYDFDGTDYEIKFAEQGAAYASDTISLRIKGDSRQEDDEVFYVDMAGAFFSTPVANNDAFVDPDASSAEVSIVNDDGVMDYGDAPRPYPTLLNPDFPGGEAGARHLLVNPNAYLGSGVDGEGDGKPTELADGDDKTTTADEDGVQFVTDLRPDQDATIVVTANIGGYLYAWFDWDADNRWDEGDQVFAAQWLEPGSHELTVSVPGDAQVGHTFARFRFSTTTGGQVSQPSGLAEDGEVEDYRVEIKSPDIVRDPDGNVTVSGRAYDADEFIVNFTTETVAVSINGDVETFFRSEVASITFNGLSGTDGTGSQFVDTVTINGSEVGSEGEIFADGIYSAVFKDGGPLTGASLVTVTALNSERITLDGGGGRDVLKRMNSTAYDDEVVVRRADVTMTGRMGASGPVLYVNRALGFEETHVYGSVAGADTVQMHDSDDADLFSVRANLDDAFMALYDETWNDGFNVAELTYYNRVSGFKTVTAVADASGNDVVKMRLRDSTAVDTFEAYPTYAILSQTDQYTYRANSYEQVHAYATAGIGVSNDIANVHGSDADDVFSVDAEQQVAFMADRAAVAYMLRTKYFGKVYADLGGQGAEGDLAKFDTQVLGPGNILTVRDADDPTWLDGTNWVRLETANEIVYEAFKMEAATASGKNETSLDRKNVHAAVDWALELDGDWTDLL
jgi:hypothetical protein